MQVLEELSKIYLAIDTELSSYLALSFGSSDNPRDERDILVRLEARGLQIRLAEAKGHCHKIRSIYERYLRTWFDNVLNTSEARDLQSLFETLSASDYAMLYQMDSLVSWLAPEAEGTLDAVDAGDLTEADARVRLARKEILPVRRAVTAACLNSGHCRASSLKHRVAFKSDGGGSV